jgi:hypothetical protein
LSDDSERAAPYLPQCIGLAMQEEVSLQSMATAAAYTPERIQQLPDCLPK